MTCADCGITDRYTADFTTDEDGRTICRHRYACEARQMLNAGASSAEAAAHAQKPRPW